MDIKQLVEPLLQFSEGIAILGLSEGQISLNLEDVSHSALADYQYELEIDPENQTAQAGIERLSGIVHPTATFTSLV